MPSPVTPQDIEILPGRALLPHSPRAHQLLHRPETTLRLPPSSLALRGRNRRQKQAPDSGSEKRDQPALKRATWKARASSWTGVGL